MLIKKLEKKKSKYLVLIEDKEYTFVEDVILKYKILENHEIDSKTLEDAISLNHILEYYDKALSYHLKYGKGSFEIKRYLYDKGLNDYEATKIVNLMIERKILDDDKLLDSLIESLVRKQNGKALIREKLYQKGYPKDIINIHLENIDMDEYYYYLEKLYEKIKDKYNKYDDFNKINRIKVYLFSRGYSMGEISILDLN